MPKSEHVGNIVQTNGVGRTDGQCFQYFQQYFHVGRNDVGQGTGRGVAVSGADAGPSDADPSDAAFERGVLPGSFFVNTVGATIALPTKAGSYVGRLQAHVPDAQPVDHTL